MPDNAPEDLPEEKYWPWRDDAAASTPSSAEPAADVSDSDGAPPVRSAAEHVLPADERRVGGERRAPIPRRLLPERRVSWGRDVPTDRRSGTERRTGERRGSTPSDSGTLPQLGAPPLAEPEGEPAEPTAPPAPPPVPVGPAPSQPATLPERLPTGGPPSAPPTDTGDGRSSVHPGAVVSAPQQPRRGPEPQVPPTARRWRRTERRGAGSHSRQRLLDVGLLLLAVAVLALAYIAVTG